MLHQHLNACLWHFRLRTMRIDKFTNCYNWNARIVVLIVLLFSSRNSIYEQSGGPFTHVSHIKLGSVEIMHPAVEFAVVTSCSGNIRSYIRFYATAIGDCEIALNSPLIGDYVQRTFCTYARHHAAPWISTNDSLVSRRDKKSLSPIK